jgi:DNA polymerase-3 subunit epsilon/ATP-dependent DNA helicase DinG
VEIADILLPRLSDRSLTGLAKQLEIPCPVQHRALADAKTAKEVFLALLNKASELDLQLIAEINRATAGIDWSWRSFFLDIERSKIGAVSLWDWGREASKIEFVPLSADSGREEPLVPKDIIEPLDLDRLTTILGQDGPMAKAFIAFEHRTGQVSMMQAVAQSLNESQHLIVEAGTGIGKSIAYLLPSIFFALCNNARIVVSTNTINLQEQLMNKDVPDLLQVLGIMQDQTPLNLRVAQLKGRRNYLCLRQWNSWRKTPSLSQEEVEFLARILIWLSSSSTGDRAELNLAWNEDTLWNRVCASEDNCTPEQCTYYKNGCFLYHARREAEKAHLIIANHALLLSDLVKNKILPEYSHLIIDEAHHLEEEATEQLGYEIGQQDLLDFLSRISGRGGVLFQLENSLRIISIAPLRREEIEQKVASLAERVKTAQSQVSRFSDILTYFLRLHMKRQWEYEYQLRLNEKVRHQSEWAEVEVSWENLSLQFGGVETDLSELYSMLESLPDSEDSNLGALMAELISLQQQVWGLRSQLNSFVSSPETNTIYWISLRGQDDTPRLHAAPLHVGQALQESLFWQKDCIVLTGATLSTEGNFEYMKERLGLKGANELMIDAPFDYVTSVMIYLPEDIPEPERPEYQRKIGQSLVELCRATQGHTLALFTSRAALRATHAAIQPPLEEEGILVLGQGIDGGPKRLLDTFKTDPRTVLLGTASLWEGIDVVGKALSVLVIARLPFKVPTDPVFSARSELFDDAFNQYLVPQAVLKFKQGFGRLIRSKHDKGVMVVLDRRLQTKPYGRAFLQSLPKCTVRSGRLRQMPQTVVKWLGLT